MTNNSSDSAAQQEKELCREKQERMEQLARQFNDDADGLRLHHELCNPAVAEAATQCRVVWAQVKGYPYWPAQILLPKDAKIRFRDTAQEYSDKRMATHQPVHFFVTREISWVLSKQVKSWAQGVADGCHTKNRMNGTFRDSLLQVCDLLYGRKAPSGFAKPTQPAIRQRSAPSPSRPARLPPASPAASPAAPQTHSPQQGRSAPRCRPHNSADHFAEEVERSRNAILGGMSRDERHRRREECRATEAATQPSPSDTVSPPASMATQATATVNTHPPLQTRGAAAQPPRSSSGGVEGVSGGRGPGTPGSSAAVPERDSGGENAPKRHTRSQGVAELGMSDLRNLEPRKVLRRGVASVPHVTTSGMGSRGTGDGATGRPPVETPQSVGTAPFADARPRSISASLPAEFGARAMPGSPRSTHLSGDAVGRRVGGKEGGSTRQAQSAGPVLSTPAPTRRLCKTETTSPRKRQRVADVEVTAEESVKNAADSSGLQLTGAEAPVYSGAAATSASQHQPLLDLSVGPEPRECPPVVCQEGSYVHGPSPRVAESVRFPPQPSAEPRQRSPARSPPANVISGAPCEAQAASAVTNGTSEVEKPPVMSQALKPEPDASAAAAVPDARHGAKWQQDAADSQQPRAAAVPAQAQPYTSAVSPEVKQHSSVQRCDKGLAAAKINGHRQGQPAQHNLQPQRNGVTAPCVPPENGVLLATQDEVAQDVGGSVNGDDDLDAEAPAAEAVVKRPRRAARARKTAQELVNGDAARGIGLQKTAEREVSRGADGGSRNTSSQQAGGAPTAGAAQRRKSAAVAATASEVHPVRRTRSANAPGVAVVSQAELVGQAPVSPDSNVGKAALFAAAAGGKSITHHAIIEQIAVLHSQPQTEDTKQYVQQLQAMLQSLQAQAVVDAAGALRGTHSVAAAVAPPMAAPASVAPARLANMVSVKEAITGMFSRGCDVAEVTEFWLPHQYLLMRTSLHQHSDVNKYPPELKPKRLRKDVQICTCTRRVEYKRSDAYCCGDGCLNRSASILCDPRSCPCRGDCQNKPFNLRKHPAVEVTLTESRGKGLFARESISKGQFVVEYTGEVMNETERLSRMLRSRNNGELHFYIMELSPGLYIDAARVGSNARFMNSSCDPNCETQKWKDAATGETRIGLFTTRPVAPGEELTYDYHFQHAGLQNAAQGFRCMCGSANCRGTMDENPERMRDAGRKVRIKWDDDDKWYEGYVLRYHPNTRKHTIYYPVDGDAAGTQETLLLDDVEHMWMDDAMTAQLPVAAAAAVAAGSGAFPTPAPLKAAAINPDTGLPAGQAAVNATLERIRREQLAGTPAEQQPRVAAAVPEQVAAPAVAAPPAAPAAVTTAAVQATQRVPLPRPLPIHPPERGAAPEPVAAIPETPADGLELLSSVAASLPDRSHTPAIAHGGDMSMEGTEGVPSSMSAAATSQFGARSDGSGLSQMPMFAVLALLQPRITDTSQLQRAPLPAAEPAITAPPGPAQQEQQQQLLQSPLQSAAAQQQALTAAVAAAAPSPERMVPQQQQQQQLQPQVAPQPSASALRPSDVATGAPVVQGAGSPASPQADNPAVTLPQAVQVMRTISPSPSTQAPQVLMQAAYPSGEQTPQTPAQGFPFPAISQYQALQSMQASMHVQAAQAQHQQQATPLQPSPPAPAQPQQQSPQAVQSPPQPHAQQQHSVAQQQAHLQLLAAANWPQHAQPALAASMHAMLQQVITSMQRGDSSAAASMQTALSVQQQQMLCLAASLPVQVAASQPVAAQPAPRALPSQLQPSSPSAAQQQQQVALNHSSPHGAMHAPHAGSSAGVSDAGHPAQSQGVPITAAAQAAVAALLSTPPRSPSNAARTAHDPAAPAHGTQQGGLQAREHPGLFASSPAATAAGSSDPPSAQGAPSSATAPSAVATTVQMLTSAGEQRSAAHGGMPQSSEAAPHPMRFAEQLQRGAGEARPASQPATSSGHTASGAVAAPATAAPPGSSVPPAAQPGTRRVSAFMVNGTEAPAQPVQGGSDHVLHAASAGAASPAPAPAAQANGGASPGVHASNDGGDAAHRHWLLALNVNEDTIRTWYSYARDHLKIADPLHEAHRGDFIKFMSDLQKSMAIHQYMAQARQPQHATASAQAPVLGQMVAHAAPQLPWTGPVSGGQPQAPVAHVPHWGPFRPR